MADIHLAIRMKDAGEELDDLTVSAIRSAAAEHPGVVHGGDIPKPGGQRIAPALVVLAMAGAVTLAQFLVDLWEKLRGGLVIDIRKEGPEVYRDSDIPAGYIVILAKDGSVKVETKDTPKSSIQQLIESVISGVFSSADQIAHAATEVGAEAAATVRT